MFDSYNEEWLDFIAANRKLMPVEHFDAVEGGVANDRIFRTVELYFAEEISKERSEIEENQNSAKIEDTENSKDYNAKNNKTLLFFGMIIVAALVGGILILWNYFKK